MRKYNYQSRPALVNNIVRLVSIFLLGAAVLTASVRATQSVWLPHVYGASRPDLWEVQMDKRDYFVIKNPATNAARKTRPTQELSLRPEVYEVVGHMKHPVCHLPIRMLTWWMNASHLSHQLGQTCRCGEEHVPCWGGNTAQQAARYNPHLEEAGVVGVSVINFVTMIRPDDKDYERFYIEELCRKVWRQKLP